MPIFDHIELILSGQEKLISSHFGNLVKLNSVLLNLSFDLLNNNLPIISGRILNPDQGMVLQNRGKKCKCQHIRIIL